MALRPGKYNPLKPDIELFDNKSKKRYGLRLSGQGALQIATISQDDTVHVRAAGKRVGDFDEQRSWKGGRGIDKLSDNPEGFWDSMNAWTLGAGHAHQTILMEFARGLRSVDFDMPNSLGTSDVKWFALVGTKRYLSISWSSMGFAADYARLWIRRVGTPGTLTFKLHSNSSGSPGTTLKTVTVTTADVTDYISVLQLFDWTTTQTLTASTTYHISVEGPSTDNQNNHWEIGGKAGTTGKVSSDGSSWSVANFDMYYYVADADLSRTFYAFFLDEAMHLVAVMDDGSHGNLYINGDRGIATSATPTTIVDSVKNWPTNKWQYALVKIVRGTGAGQVRLISSSATGTLTVSQAWATLPDTTSAFIIYSTPWFTKITDALNACTNQPIVVNNIVYFPQNETVTKMMIYNDSLKGYTFFNDTNQAFALIAVTTQNGVQIWRARNTSGTGAKTISYASAQAYSTSPAALTFSTAKNVGDSTHKITNILEKDGLIYVFKEDGVYYVNPTSTLIPITKLQNGMEKTPSPANGRAVIAHQQFIYQSWLHSMIRIYGSSHDDVGQDWSGYGLPDGREGEFSSLESYTSLLIAGVDATTGTSSVLAFDGIGWHELLRAYDDNMRIRMVKVQPVDGGRNRLWTDIGGDLVFQKMPSKKGSPRLDSGIRYMHEMVIESSAIDMGTASALAKFIKELTVYSKNLGEGNEIFVDYQVDDDIHTSNWTHATVLHQSPEASAFLGLGNVRAFAYRLRVLARTSTMPVDIIGIIPNGYARSPYKMVWTLRCRADNITSRGRLVKPDQLMRWLLDNARFPGQVQMLSQYELAHNYWVVIHPPRMFPYKPAQNGQSEESMFTLVLEEA